MSSTLLYIPLPCFPLLYFPLLFVPLSSLPSLPYFCLPIFFHSALAFGSHYLDLLSLALISLFLTPMPVSFIILMYFRLLTSLPPKFTLHNQVIRISAYSAFFTFQLLSFIALLNLYSVSLTWDSHLPSSTSYIFFHLPA